MKHKWHDEIVAWANGAEIEARYCRLENTEWVNIRKNPHWDDSNFEYRIKPQPKEPQYLYVYFNTFTKAFELDIDEVYLNHCQYIGKIKLEQDDETT